MVARNLLSSELVLAYILLMLYKYCQGISEMELPIDGIIGHWFDPSS